MNKLVEELQIVKLAEKYSTPLYVYDLEKIRRKLQEINAAIPYVHKNIHYAAMCNSNPQVLKKILKSGAFLQVNSTNEYKLGIKVGFPGDRISVTTTNISPIDMLFYAENRAMINFDSIEEIERYGQTINNLQKKQKVNRAIGIRIFIHNIPKGKITNAIYPGKARVGIPKDCFANLKVVARKFNLRIIGIHGHMASNILDEDSLINLSRELVEQCKRFSDLEYINFGGGFGVASKPEDKSFDWISYGIKLTKLMQQVSDYFGKDIILKIEPGRSLVAESGLLLCRVTNIKQMSNWTEIGVDAGFGNFPRPYIYGWKDAGYHEIIKINNLGDKELKKYTICGNSVLQRDYLAEDRILPELKIGDLLAFKNAGAYCAAMASGFPGYQLPQEIVIQNKI